MSIADKLTTVAENVQKVYEAGKKAEYDAFWDNFQGSGNRTDYAYAFRCNWNNKNFKPKYNIAPTAMNYGFSNCEITDLSELFAKQGVTFDTSRCTDLTAAFQASPRLTRVPKIDLSSISDNKAINLFNTCQKLQEVEEIVFTEALTNAGSMFNWCTKLKKIKVSGTIDVTISFSHSSGLNAQSIVSIVEALSTATTSKSVTFNSSAISTANWSETEYESWDALLATRPNWTFVLS